MAMLDVTHDKSIANRFGGRHTTDAYGSKHSWMSMLTPPAKSVKQSMFQIHSFVQIQHN